MLNKSPEKLSKSTIKLQKSIDRVKKSNYESRFDNAIIDEKKSSSSKYLGHLNKKSSLKSFFAKNQKIISQIPKLSSQKSLTEVKRQIQEVDEIAKMHDKYFNISYKSKTEDITAEYWKNISDNKHLNDILLKIRDWNYEKEKEMFSIKTFQREFEQNWYQKIKNLEVEEYEKLMGIIHAVTKDPNEVIDINAKKRNFRFTKMSLLKKIENTHQKITPLKVIEKFKSFITLSKEKNERKLFQTEKTRVFTFQSSSREKSPNQTTNERRISSKKELGKRVKTEQPISSFNLEGNTSLENEKMKKLINILTKPSTEFPQKSILKNKTLLEDSPTRRKFKIDSLTEEGLIKKFGYEGRKISSTSSHSRLNKKFPTKLKFSNFSVMSELHKNDKMLEKWKDFTSINLRKSPTVKLIQKLKNHKKNKERLFSEEDLN